MRRGKTREEDTIISHPHVAGSPPVPALANFNRSMILTPGSAVVHRDVHEWIGGFVDILSTGADRDYWIKAGLHTGFAFCERTVLDKVWREGAMSESAALRITDALRSQLMLRSWCRTRGVDTSVIPETPLGMIRKAFQDAGFHRQWGVFPKLTAIALRYWMGCRV